jgi:hypothetical protein
VAAGAVIPFAIDTMWKLIATEEAAVAGAGLHASGVAMIHVGVIDFTWLLNLLTIPFGLAVFVVVWLASHAINVLILLSPWGAIDAALKGVRTALLGLVTAVATTDPRWGAIFSVGIIIFSYFIAGWAFRLTIFGSIFSWEFLTLRCRRFRPKEDANRLFSGANFPEVPVRTYGKLVKRADSGLDFVYKPWLVMPERVATVPAELPSIAVGTGFFFSNVIAADGRTLFLLPPRYRTHEEELVRIYELGGGVRDAGLRRAWGAMREMFGGRAVKPPASEALPVQAP